MGWTNLEHVEQIDPNRFESHTQFPFRSHDPDEEQFRFRSHSTQTQQKHRNSTLGTRWPIIGCIANAQAICIACTQTGTVSLGRTNYECQECKHSDSQIRQEEPKKFIAHTHTLVPLLFVEHSKFGFRRLEINRRLDTSTEHEEEQPSPD